MAVDIAHGGRYRKGGDDDSEPRGFPPGFNVSAYPILARHWFGAPPFVLDESGGTKPVKIRPNHHGGQARHAALRQA